MFRQLSMPVLSLVTILIDEVDNIWNLRQICTKNIFIWIHNILKKIKDEGDFMNLVNNLEIMKKVFNTFEYLHFNLLSFNL